MKPIRAFNPKSLWPPKDNQYEKIVKAQSSYKKIELEIGAGMGLHPIKRAQDNPKTLILAAERTREKFEAFQKRMNVYELKNLIGVHADAIPWIWHMNPTIKFSKIWLLYPNPEMQNKTRRWINSPFFHHLLERLLPTGEIEIATNIKTYAEEIKKVSEEIWKLEYSEKIYKGEPRTHFEKKYLERGETCYQIVLRNQY